MAKAKGFKSLLSKKEIHRYLKEEDEKDEKEAEKVDEDGEEYDPEKDKDEVVVTEKKKSKKVKESKKAKKIKEEEGEIGGVTKAEFDKDAKTEKISEDDEEEDKEKVEEAKKRKKVKEEDDDYDWEDDVKEEDEPDEDKEKVEEEEGEIGGVTKAEFDSAAKTEKISEDDEEDEDKEKVEEEDEEEDKDKVEEEDEEDEKEIKEHVSAILKGGNLSEEFRSNVETLFTSAVRSKAKKINEHFKAQYSRKLKTAKKSVYEKLAEQVETYLNYLAEQYMKQNQLAIEHGLRTEITESFITSLKKLFNEHYISVPEDQLNVVDALTEKVDYLEKQLNEEISKNIENKKSLRESRKGETIDKLTAGLTTYQSEKFKKLAETVDFDTEENFTAKLSVIKEAYFNNEPKKSVRGRSLTEAVALEEEVIEEAQPQIQGYVAALNKFKK